MPDKVQQAWDSMVKNLEAKTGNSIDQWVKIAQSAGTAKHGELVKYLKTKQGLTHGYASLVAFRAIEGPGKADSGTEDVVAAQYAGGKASLRPIYDAVVAAVSRFGKDIQISPKKGEGREEDDDAARLEGVAAQPPQPRSRPEERLPPRAAEADAELIRWLRAAYDSA